MHLDDYIFPTWIAWSIITNHKLHSSSEWRYFYCRIRHAQDQHWQAYFKIKKQY